MRKQLALVYAALISTAVVLLLPIILVLKCLIRLAGTKPVSVWVGAPIINMTVNCKAERLLGFRSFTCVSSSYFITDMFDFQLHRIAGPSLAARAILTIMAAVAVATLASQVHAYPDGGLLPSLRHREFSKIELLLYRLTSVKLVIWTYGSDVRTKRATMALGHPCCCTYCPQIGLACICSDSDGAKNYFSVARQAMAVFSMGDMIEYCPGSNNSLFYWPLDLGADNGRKYSPVYPTACRDKSIRVVHAPNHREFKGTKHLEDAVAQLQSEGFDIELTLVEKVPNNEAIKIYKSADVIFDQCLIGFHGYFALEAMALGKPVMCFIRKPETYLLAPDECPIINTSVQTLTNDLRVLVERRGDLEEIGRKSRSYVEKYYTLEAFAARLAKAYRDIGLIT